VVKRSANALPKLAKPGGEAAGASVHVLGPADAAVTIEEFGDFNVAVWAPLGTDQSVTKEIQSARDLPEFSTGEPQVGEGRRPRCEAASRQGKFWQMHDLLYREQGVWSQSSDARTLFPGLRRHASADLGQFRQDMDSPEVQRQVEVDQQRGAASG